MCVMSAVMDYYRPYIPDPNAVPWGPYRPPHNPSLPFVPPQKIVINPAQDLSIEIAELRELIDSFHKAVEAAEVFDRLTGQPDCVDPEKAELEERVIELERRLDAIADAASGDVICDCDGECATKEECNC